jgi:hypothetical protein
MEYKIEVISLSFGIPMFVSKKIHNCSQKMKKKVIINDFSPFSETKKILN